MKRSEFLNTLDELIEAKPGTVQGNETLADLTGWDSLALVGFIAVVDQQFGLPLSASKLQSCVTVADLIALLPQPLE
ncbi:MAG: acyl carrier protein [Myxococcaceae bacterium]|nr:acyl carrier protein [Myxococcaceae bacterium]